jgi:hypothetical protein
MKAHVCLSGFGQIGETYLRVSQSPSPPLFHTTLQNLQGEHTQATTARTVENNLAIQHAVQQVVADAQRSRPKNTAKNYENKQPEWISWCEKQLFADGSLVHGGKLLLFPRDVVVPRGSRKMIGGEPQPLTADGLEGYVKPIVDLYSTQRSLGLNREPHPRGSALKGYLKSEKQQRSKRKRIEYQDRGEGTVQDTYSTRAEEYRNPFLYRQDGTWSPRSPRHSPRARTDGERGEHKEATAT